VAGRQWLGPLSLIQTGIIQMIIQLEDDSDAGLEWHNQTQSNTIATWPPSAPALQCRHLANMDATHNIS